MSIIDLSAELFSDSEMDDLWHINCRNPNLKQMDMDSTLLNV
jgi:hypothetical protein